MSAKMVRNALKTADEVVTKWGEGGRRGGCKDVWKSGEERGARRKGR